MADEVKYLDIQIKETKALRYMEGLSKEMARLKEEQKRAKDQTGETSQEYIQLTAKLKATKKEYNQQNNVLTKVIDSNRAADDSLKGMRSRLSVVSDEYSRLTKYQRKNTERGKALRDEKTKLTETLKDEEKATGDARRNVGNYTEASQELLGSMGSLSPAFQKAGVAAKLLGKAMTFALGPIGLIIAAIAMVATAVKSFLTSSEEGQNAMTKMANKASVTWSVFNDRLADAGEAIYNFFTENEDGVSGFSETWESALDWFKGAWQSIKNFLVELWESPTKMYEKFTKMISEKTEAVKDFISGAWGIVKANLMRALSAMLLAYEKFVGKFTDNTDSIIEAQEKYNKATEEAAVQNEKVAKAYDKLKKKVVNSGVYQYMQGVADEIEREVAAMDRLSDRAAALAKAQRANLVQEAKQRVEIARLRNESGKRDKLNAEERKAALDEAIRLEQEQLNKSLALKREEYNIEREKNNLGKSTIEDKEREAKLLSEVYKLKEQSLTKEIALERRRQQMIREINNELMEQANIELQLFIEKNQSKLENAEKINDEILKAETDRLNEVFNKEKEFLDKKKELGLLKEDEYNLALLQKENELNAQLDAIDDQRKAAEIEKEAKHLVEITEQEKAYRQAVADARGVFDNQTALAKIDAEKALLEQKYEAEIANARRIGADTTLIEAAYAEQKKKLAMMEFQAKASLAADFANNIAQIAGENTKVGRIAAATATSINAIQSATAAFAALAPIPIVGPALGATAAAAALVSGYKNVKKILNTKSGLPGDSGGGGGGGGGGGDAPTPPPTANTTPPTENMASDIATRRERGRGTQKTTVAVVVDDVTAKQKDQETIDTLSNM